MKTNFLGGANVARSLNLADNRLVNLYPELGGDGAKEIGAFFGTPGLSALLDVGNGPIRGMLPYFDTFLYVVSGGELYQIDESLNAVLIGVVPGSEPVSMAHNEEQVFVATNGDAYQYDLTTRAYVQLGFSAGTVVYLNSFFIFDQKGSQIFFVYDGVAFDPLEFSEAEGAPDHIVCLVADHRELWIFGQIATEVWYASGGEDFPFAPIQGAFIEKGCAARASPAKLDNSIFWLGQDLEGHGVVWRAQGYTPVRVSTHAIELAIGSYSRIDDAIGFGYQQEGHTFYVLTFPTGNATWVYDVATGLWHERAYMDPATGELGRWRANCFAYFRGRNIVGDFENGNLYTLDLGKFTDNGDAIKWVRSFRALPTGQNAGNRTFHHALQLEGQMGVGLASGQGSDPQVMLRWSDDGGHTWSNEHWRSMGKIGKTGHRCMWRRLGSTEKLRDRVYEISGTDPVKRALTGCELILTGGGS